PILLYTLSLHDALPILIYFSYKIIEEYPFVLEVLRKKSPYFFIDEFQDSNPVQVRLVENLAHEETTIGIIGDKAQSIYEFQGARSEEPRLNSSHVSISY